MESKVFSLFQISLENFFKTKFYLGHHLRLQPSEIDNLDFYEYTYYVQNLMEYLKQKQKQEGQQQEQQQEQMADYKKYMPNPNSYKSPKMPSKPSGGMKMPKF